MTKFTVDQDEIEVSELLGNLDRQKEAYLNSKNWSDDQKRAFSTEYNRIRSNIANGTISGRSSDRSYIDSSKQIVNATEGEDTVGEVLLYVDQILDSRPAKKTETAKKKKYSNDELLKAFMNDQFGGSTFNLKAWEEGEYDEATDTYRTDNRRRKFADFLTKYRDSLSDDYDYTGSAYADKTDLQGRLNDAIRAMGEGDNYYDELGRLGLGEDFVNNAFRTKGANYKSDDDLLREAGYDWAIGLDPVEKAEVLAEIKAGKGSSNEGYEAWKKKKTDDAEAKEWEDFVKNGAKSYNPSTVAGNLTYDRKKLFYDFGENNNNLDVESLLKGYSKSGIKYNALRDQFSKDLIDYMSNGDFDWDNRIREYNTSLGVGDYGGALNDDYRKRNRFATSSYFTESILNPYYFESFKGQHWNDKHFVDNYQALVQHETESGGENLVRGDAIGLKENEYYIKGMWDPEKFVFYTYDSNGGIKTHRIDESPQMLEEWKAAGYFKKRNNPEKKQEGGIIFKKTEPKSNGLTDEQRIGLDKDYNRKKAGERVVSDELRPEDFIRFGAIGADVASLVASFVPGYGTAASGVLGIGSTLGNLAADAMDESVSAGQVLTNLVANVGLTALGLVPGGNAPKLAAKIAKYTPKIIAAASTLNVAFNDDIHKSLGKVASGDDLTVNDWRNIGIALSTVAGATRWGTAAYKAKKFKSTTEKTDNFKIKAKGSEKEIELSKEQLVTLQSKKTNQEAVDYLNSIGKMPKGQDGKPIDLTFIKDGKNLGNWFGLSKGNITSEQITTTKDNPRIAYEKLRSRAADIRFKGGPRLATDYELTQGAGYIKNLNVAMPSWLRNLFTDKGYEEWLAKQKPVTQQTQSPTSTTTPRPKARKQPVSPDPYTSSTRIRNRRGQYSKLLANRLTTFDNGSLTTPAANYFKGLGTLTKNTLADNIRLAKMLGIDPKDIRVSFSDTTGNMYYWKNGGIIKYQTGGPTGRSSYTSKKDSTSTAYDDYLPKTSDMLSGYQLYRTLQHNSEMQKLGDESLRQSYYEETPYQKQQIAVRSNLGKGQIYDQAKVQVRDTINQNLTTDSTRNALMQLSGQVEANKYDLDKKLTLNEEVGKGLEYNQAINEENALARHTSSEQNKARRAALIKALYDNKAARMHTDATSIDTALRAKIAEVQGEEKTKKAEQKKKEEQAKQVEANNYQYNQSMIMKNKLDTAKAKWMARDPEKNTSDLWESSEEYDKLYSDYAREMKNNLLTYQSNLYGVNFTPVLPVFNANWQSYKKGGKVVKRKHRNLEKAKLLQKDIHKQLDRYDKQMARLSKMTEKAINKALGL